MLIFSHAYFTRYDDTIRRLRFFCLSLIRHTLPLLTLFTFFRYADAPHAIRYASAPGARADAMRQRLVQKEAYARWRVRAQVAGEVVWQRGR